GRVADRVRQGSTRPRPPLLAVIGEAPVGARLGARAALQGGPRAHRPVVPRQRVVVGPDQERRVPRVLREAVRPAAVALTTIPRNGPAEGMGCREAGVIALRRDGWRWA